MGVRVPPPETTIYTIFCPGGSLTAERSARFEMQRDFFFIPPFCFCGQLSAPLHWSA